MPIQALVWEINTFMGFSAVDEKSGKLYGITTDRDPGLAVFSLPDNF